MTPLVKKSFRLAGHATSVALEPEFWQGLNAIAARDGHTLAQLVGRVDAARTRNLASELRVFLLKDKSPSAK